MKTVGILFALVLGFVLVREVGGRLFGVGEIEYQGEQFKLRRRFFDYEQFSKDLDPLHPDERDHARRAMLAVPAPDSAESYARLVSGLPERFPGYGHSTAGDVRDEHGTRYAVFSYEIPGSRTNRTLVYREDLPDRWTRIFDGVTPDRDEDHEISGTRRTVIRGDWLRSYHNQTLYREVDLTKPDTARR